jgi:hypothetical protein
VGCSLTVKHSKDADGGSCAQSMLNLSRLKVMTAVTARFLTVFMFILIINLIYDIPGGPKP